MTPKTTLELVGNTPLIRASRLDAGPCELFLKLESQNPGGSVKDRIGRSMIDAAERAGDVGSHQPRLVEATAGNTGLGLALVAARKGYRLTLVIPDKMSREKILHLRALGAEIVITRSDVEKGHPEYYQDLAARLAAEAGAFYVNQFENPANPLAHETTTGPEIVAALGGKLDAMVCGVGSGGTMTGLSRCFAREIPGCEMVLADPEGSILAGFVETGRVGKAGSWLVEGIGEDFVPPIADLSRVRRAYTIPDRPRAGVLRDLIARRAGEGAVVSVAPGDTLLVAYGRMKQHDVSQLPVLERGRIVGLLDESDLLAAATEDEERLRDAVSDHMTSRLVTVAPSMSIAELRPLFEEGLVPIVMDGPQFLGLVTRMDVVNFLQRQLG